MKKGIVISLYCLLIAGLGMAQSRKSKGNLLIDIHSGFRGSLSSHSTPQLTFNGVIGASGMNDRTVLAPVWNLQGKLGYGLPCIPFFWGIQTGIQWNQNVHFVGIYSFQKEFPPKRINYRTLNFGVWLGYDLFKKGNHALNATFAANALYIPSSLIDFTNEKNPTYGKIISSGGQDTITYSTVINSFSTNVKISWQLEMGLNYRYSVSKYFDLKFIVLYQLGLTNLLNTSAVFINSTNPEYYGNSSFSVNKGDGLCFNIGVGYKIPFYGKEKFP